MAARIPIAAFATALIATLSPSFSDTRLNLTGKVTDGAGKPLDHATVIVYHAGVKHGYSTFCPSCYTDCGKRTLTDASGNFTIPGLSVDLYFELLVVHDGYLPVFMKKVDAARAAPVAVLQPRGTLTDDPGRVVRGVVIDKDRNPVPDAVVEPQGILRPDVNAIYGVVPGLERVAVTNDKGEFELAHAEPFQAMVLEVEARGMAPAIFTSLATGLDRHTLVVTEGATVRGRLIENGKPVANGEIGLMARQHGWAANLALVGYPLPEIRIGTSDDGTFAISNVPPSVDWYLYGKMQSLARLGGAPIVEVATKGDGMDINVGDLSLQPAFHLRGKVALSDGKPIPPGMTMMIASDRAFDVQFTPLRPDGSFEFSGLAKGGYSLNAAVRGYGLKSSLIGDVPVKIAGDMNDFAMTLDPR